MEFAKRHNALAFLMSLSVAGTCLAAPALAGALEVETGSGIVSALEVAATTEEQAASTGTGIEVEAVASADIIESDEATEVTATENTYAMGGLQVTLPEGFEVMDEGNMMLASNADGSLVVNITPSGDGANIPADSADWPEYFNTFVEAVAEQLGAQVEEGWPGTLEDGVTEGYVYPMAYVTDDGTSVYMIQMYVPQEDGSFTLFQIAWDTSVEGLEDEAAAIAETLLPATDDAIQLGAGIQLTQVVEAGGITLSLPESLFLDEASDPAEPTYYSADANFMIGIMPALIDEFSTLGDSALDLIAEGIAAGLEGTVEGSLELVNNETTVAVYVFSFADGDTQYVGALGMVPLPDDTVTGVLALAPLSGSEAVGDLVDAVYATIEIAE